MAEKKEKKKTLEYDRHDFTATEKAEMAKEMAREIGEQQELESQIKVIKSDFKGRIEQKQASVSDLATKLRTGYEMRRVECELTFDYKKRRVYYHRTDNGKQVKDRAMFAEEIQMGLHEAGMTGPK